jgi:hypothetical protein
MHRAQFASFNKNGAYVKGRYRDPFVEFSVSVLGYLRASLQTKQA